MGKLDLSNIIRVTLLAALRGLATLNTSALAIITDEVPIPADYGDSRTYLNSVSVRDDWGSNSDVYAYALAIFGQAPNIISGKGYLVVIPRDQTAAAQAAILSGSGPVNLTLLTATDYNMNVNVDGLGAGDALIGTIDTTSLATAETFLNSTAITAAGLVITLSGDLANAIVTISTIATGGTKSLVLGDSATGTDITTLLNLPKAVTVTGVDIGVERVKDTVLRTNGSIEYFGIVLNEKQSDADLTELAALIQTLDKILCVGSSSTADLTGIYTTLLNKGYTHTRTTIYTESAALALEFAVAYISRGLSVDYNGTKTALTMHLKDITGFVADTGFSQSLLDSANKSGTDFYGDFGIPKVFTSGANMFFDQIYSNLAFKLFLQVAGFNYLAQTNTKIPQTEEGMNGLKGAYRDVCDQFVINGTFAPGAWNDATTFGDPSDHIRNIKDFGYFVYAEPITAQAQAQRDARVAPVVQIAAKESGAIHSSDVTVFIEA